MKIVGTAGHVDHGKSTLVKALTGINPDRLKEEQARQMTIDLGFASMMLQGDLEVGFVDVPGHIDFIENMLMGVGGIDTSLLVVAADEGVMAQTREHLDILHLLQVSSLIVALTKTDAVEQDWLDLVQEDVRDFLSSMGYPDVSIVPVSAQTGAGLDVLQQTLHDMLGQVPVREDVGRPRLFIDRVFSMAGFGTVVTGTLLDGSFSKGQKVVVLPDGSAARIRGMQSFNAERDTASPGNRLAVNLSGIHVDDTKRGNVVAHPGDYRVTSRIDVRVRVLESIGFDLLHDMHVKFFHGTAATAARVRLLGKEALLPGQEGFLQLVLEQPVVARFGDRFILRKPSPSVTIGGGEILDPFPERQHRRFDEIRLAKLEALVGARPVQVVEHILREKGLVSFVELGVASMLSSEELQGVLQDLADSGSIVIHNGAPSARDMHTTQIQPESAFIHADSLSALLKTIEKHLQTFHKKQPHLRGMAPEVMRSRMKMDQNSFQFLLSQSLFRGLIVEDAGRLHLPDFTVRLNDRESSKAQQLAALIKSDPLQTPSVTQIVSEFGDIVLQYLKDQDLLIQVSDQVVFDRVEYDTMVQRLIAEMQSRGAMKVTDVKEVIPTSRKYLLAFLEHLDGLGITQRDGDTRTLKRSKGSS